MLLKYTASQNLRLTKTRAGKKIKAYLSNIHKSYIENQKKVKKKDFNIKTEELEPMGQLEYVTIFPSGKIFLSYR